MIYQPVAHAIVHDVRRGVRAHASGVRSDVAVAHALVVLRAHQRSHALPVAEYQKRQFVALQAFFQHDPRPGVAQHLAAQHLGRDARRLFFAFGDDHALAGRQPIRFHDHRSVEMSERRFHLLHRIADRKGSRGDVMPLQKFLGKALARLQPRRCLGRPKHAPAAASKLVDRSESQRQLGPNQGQIRLQACRQRDHRVKTLQIGRQAFGLVRDPAIAGCAIKLRDPRRLLQLPDQRVLAPAST